MSILDRLIPNRHLNEAALAEIWSYAAAGEPSVSNRHLDACGACRARYEEFSAWADALRGEGVADADAAFPAERLAAQHAQIFRRLESLERPARVITFPKVSQPVADAPSFAYRWVAAAAAAGLVIGVGLGQWLDIAHRFDVERVPAAETRLTTTPSDRGVRLQTASAVTDEALLSELEAAATLHPSVDPLRAIDVITPRSRDYDPR